jgi:transcriptional regulator with XRE-family HTH domain
MEYLKKKLGARIQAIRKSKKMTQEKLAELVELDIPNLSNIERGKRFLSSATLERIIAALDVSAKDLFDFDHIKSRDDLLDSIQNIIKESSDKELEYYYRMMNLYKGY